MANLIGVDINLYSFNENPAAIEVPHIKCERYRTDIEWIDLLKDADLGRGRPLR